MTDILDAYGEKNKRVIRNLIKMYGFEGLEREQLSMEEIEKTLSRYKVINIRGQNKRAIPLELYVDSEIRKLKNLTKRESQVTLAELTDYLYKTKEEFVTYDYEKGDYYLINEEGHFGFFPTEDEQDLIRKALQDAL